MLKVGIIGGSGYVGAELIRLLLNHQMVDLVGVSAGKLLGKDVDEVYANFSDIFTEKYVDEDRVIADADLIFVALPHGMAEGIARKCIDSGKKVIDLGADFRLEDESDYKRWYQLDYKDKDLHKESVYGLSEIYRDKIKNAKIIGNPGCYPTSIEFGLYPILTSSWYENAHIVIDSKSGTTGAGKELSDTLHFPRLNESFAPYKVGSHRHTPEIIQTLSDFVGHRQNITFVPHLLPINRGIVSTMYVPIKNVGELLEQIHQHYRQTYKNEKFVRVLNLGQTADLKFVKYSNYCNISIHADKDSDMLIVVSCIDNMVKGAAGQAIQNMNIMYGFDEDMGLKLIPPAF